MDAVIQFFKAFGNIINTGLLISLIGLALAIFGATIEQKDAELSALHERLKTDVGYSPELSSLQLHI